MTGFNPFEGIDIENLFGTEEHDQRHFENSGCFFDTNGHNDAFKPHPLAWDSITYRKL